MKSWMKDARDKLHTTLHATTLVAMCIMARQCERREMYEDITLPVGTNTHKALVRTIDAGKKLHVLPDSDNKYFIVDEMWDVNLSLDEAPCGCREYVQTGLPCIHMAAAYVHPHKPGRSDLPEDLADYADPHY
jgi:hypothetical protein